MTIQLHCFGESGNAYKAALALELSGLDWAPVFVDFFNGATRGADYRRDVNVMGEAPVMVDGDLKLTQSGVIQDYISSKTGKLGGRSAAERRKHRIVPLAAIPGRVVQAVLAAEDHRFFDHPGIDPWRIAAAAAALAARKYSRATYLSRTREAYARLLGPAAAAGAPTLSEVRSDVTGNVA